MIEINNQRPFLSNKQNILNNVMNDLQKFMYENLLLSIPVSFICSCLVFVTLYSIDHSKMVLIWFQLVILISFFRIGIFFIYRYHLVSKTLCTSLFIIGAILAGTLWGISGSFLMPHDHLLRQIIILIIIAGVTAGSIQTLQSNLFACFSYLFLIMTPLIIWFFIQHSIEYHILGIAMVTYLSFLLIASWRAHKLLKTKIELYYENKELVDNLYQTYNKLQQSYTSLSISEERFHNLMKNSPLGTGITDFSGHFLEANDALCHIFGYSREELLKKTFKELTYPPDLPKELKLIDDLISGKISYFQIDKRHQHKDGHLIWTLLTVTLLRSSSGKLDQLTGQLYDISERKQNEEELKKINAAMIKTLNELKEHDHQNALLGKMNDMLLMCANCDEAYPRINMTAKQLFPELSGALAILDEKSQTLKITEQWGEEKLLSPTFSFLDCFGFRTGNMIVTENPEVSVPCPHFISPPEGGVICSPLIAEGKTIGGLYFFAKKGKIINKKQQILITIFSNMVKITLANIKLHELLQDQSIHDHLTGLYNRRYLDEFLPHELLRMNRVKNKLCIAMLDLDNFKKFNDSYGHEAGDEVLKFIGLILQKNFRGSDFACRYGGEEFLVILIDTEPSKAIHRFQKLCEEIKNENVFFQSKPLPRITVSIGIAFAPEHGSTQAEIIFSADSALYKAKNSGRDRIEIFNNPS